MFYLTKHNELRHQFVCLDSGVKGKFGSVGFFECHGQKGPQVWLYRKVSHLEQTRRKVGVGEGTGRLVSTGGLLILEEKNGKKITSGGHVPPLPTPGYYGYVE